MKCTKCGWPLPEDSVFCQYCGEKVGVEDEMLVRPPQEAEEGSRAEPEPPALDTPEARTEREEEAVTPAGPEEPTAAETPTENRPESEALAEDELKGGAPAEENITPMVEQAASPSPGEAPARVEAGTGKRQRYCSRCGSPVDRKTKKCQGCGKQYFRLRRLGIWLLAVLCLALVGLNVFQYTQIISTQEHLEQVNETLSAQEKTISEQKKEISDQKNKISNLKSDVATYRNWWREASLKAAFMDDYVVIIGDSNNRYHKYGCEALDLSSFRIYNTKSARAQGYRACTKCIQ